MLDPEVVEALKAYTQNLSREVTLVIEGGEHEKKDELHAMLHALAAVSSKIALQEASGLHAGMRSPLSFKLLADGDDTGITFSGIPGGHEFNSLVLAILQAGGTPVKLDAGIQSLVRSIQEPLSFETVVSLSCQNCPDVVQALNQLALLNPNITHEMIDGGLYPEVVSGRNVQGVPAVFLNGKSFAQGKIDVGQIMEKVMALVPEQRAPESSVAATEAVLQDVVVIGGGPAGVAASVYAARKGLKVTLVADRLGGQVKDTMGIENLISVPKTTGPELAIALETHLSDYAVTVKKHLKVKQVELGDPKRITLTSGETIQTKTIIVATGAKWRELGVPGEKEYIGKGVAYCPHCDGPFFKDKDVAVIGGGNSGVEAALDLAGIVKSVTVVEFLPELKADQVLVDQMARTPNIKVLKNFATRSINAENGKVVSITCKDRETEALSEVPVAGVFIQIGLVPNSAFMKDVVEMTRFGEIVVNARCETNVPGVFACGDVTTVPYKQIIISMGEGAKAALSAFEAILKSEYHTELEPAY